MGHVLVPLVLILYSLLPAELRERGHCMGHVLVPLVLILYSLLSAELVFISWL
jgi:hypothetical protein